MNYLLLALRNIRHDRGRTLSTVLIIAVSLMALLISMGFMLSSYDSLQEMAKRSEGHVIISNDNTSMQTGSHQQLTLTDWQEISDELWDDERILRILPRARFEGVISHKNQSAAFFGTGVDAKEEFRVYGPFLRTKGVLDPWLGEAEMPDIILGHQLAKALNANKGDTLKLHVFSRNNQHNIVKVSLAGVYYSGDKHTDSHTLMVNIGMLNQLVETDKISQLSIYLNNSEDAIAVQQTLQKQFTDLSIQTWHQRAELYDKVKAQYDRIFSVLGIIILVVITLSISNTIALIVHQRRDEIATLSALGTRPSRIYANFILEALIIGLIATSLGMLIAYLCTHLINSAHFMMPAPPGRNEGYPIFVYISWSHYFVSSFIFIIITAFASFIATYKASKIKITEALL